MEIFPVSGQFLSFLPFYLSSPSVPVIEQHPHVADFGASGSTSMDRAACSHCLTSPSLGFILCRVMIFLGGMLFSLSHRVGSI